MKKNEYQITVKVFIFLFLIAKTVSGMTQERRLLLDIYVNSSKQHAIYDSFIDHDNNVWLQVEDLKSFDMTQVSGELKVFQDETYLSLNSWKGVEYELNEQELSLYLTVPSIYFSRTEFDLAGGDPARIRPLLAGAYLNYDFSVQHTNIAAQTNAAVISELVYFNPHGIGRTNFFVQGGNSSSAEWIRLESVWTIDQPEKITTWNIGDSITANATWSGAVRFAGIQWATNFNTQPYLVTFPLPAFSGQAVVPTTLSVFVNDALNITEEIKNGPFTIYDIPVVTGAGNVKVVINDILGRQRESIIPYYTSQQLLKEGLVDFSYELGVIRDNYGIASFDYSQLVGVGTYNKGINNRWTAGWHIELLRSQQTLGISNEYLWNSMVILTSGAAVSHNSLGSGGLLLFGLQRQTQIYSYGVQMMPCTVYFTELGFVEDQPAPSIQLQSWGTIGTEKWGTLSISYTLVNNRIPDQEVFNNPQTIEILPDAELLTVNYTHHLIDNVYFVLGSIVDFNQSDNNVFFLSLVWGFKENYSLSSTASFQSGDNQQTFLLNKNIPWGNGYGYNISFSQGDPDQAQGAYTYQNDYGTYSATIARIGNETNYLGEIIGSVVQFGGHTLLARELYNSFALVEIPEFEDVCVYNRNECIGKTNRVGVLLVPNLLPYQKNTVSIDVKEFPLTASIPLFELNGTPYYRSGIFMSFPVKHVTHYTMQLMMQDGQFVPLGAKVFLEESDEHYYVMQEGFTFFSSEKKADVAGYARWEENQCHFVLHHFSSDEPIVNVGGVTCH